MAAVAGPGPSAAGPPVDPRGAAMHIKGKICKIPVLDV